MTEQLEFDFDTLRERILKKQRHIEAVSEELRTFRDGFNLGTNDEGDYDEDKEVHNYNLIDVTIDVIDDLWGAVRQKIKEQQ